MITHSKTISKKEFVQKCSFHEYGRGKSKRNAIYYDYQQGTDENGNRFSGFRFMVKAVSCDATKKELTDILYDWVTEKIDQVPWYVEYRYAKDDKERFKVSLMG